MNDPVLNRKLFRHQAQIIHNKIPKYQYGGGIPANPWSWPGMKQSLASQQAAAQAYWKKHGARKLIAQAASPGKYLKGAKYAYKFGMPYVKAGLQKTGIARLFREATGQKPSWSGSLTGWAAKKAPKTYGTAKIGVGGALGLYGVNKGYEGLKEGDYGKAALGLGESLWGTGIVIRGGQLFSHGIKSKKGIKAFKDFGKGSKPFKDSGIKGKWRRSKADYGVLPLMVGGALTSKDVEAGELKYDLTGVSEKQLNEINNKIHKIAKDKANPTIDEANKAIGIWIDENKGKKQEGKQETKEEGAASTFEAEGTVPKSGSPVNPEEAKLLAAQKEENAKAEAGALKKEFDNSDMKTKKEFLEFRKAITDLTGTYGNDRDLILMKLASGMMGGTTPHKGLKGFLDVAGDAMGPTVDTALALSNAQKGRDNQLAMSFLKMKQEEAKAAEGGGIKLKGQLKTFLVKDPATADSRGSLYGQKVVTGQYDDNAGLIYEMGTNQTYELLQGEGIREAKGTGAQLQKSRSKLSSMAIGLDYVNHILFDMDDDLKGVTGWARLLASDWISESNTWTGMQNKYTQGADNIAKYVDNEILDPSLFTDKEGRPKMTTIVDEDGKEREIRQYDWAVQHLQQEDAKDIKNAQDANRGWFGAQVSTEELDQLTKAALIENRLKYIIANANKSEDRLTRWDIENAEKNTSVLSFYSLKRRFSAAGVNSQMRALKDELQGNFDKEARNYQELGGTNDYLLSFNSVQRIREWNLAEEGKVPLDQTINVLESIQVPAALKEGGFVGA